MAEDKKTGAESAAGAAKKTEQKTYQLKKPMRYRGAMRVAGYPVVLSDSRRTRLAVKGYV